jgi:hypothetical protein
MAKKKSTTRSRPQTAEDETVVVGQQSPDRCGVPQRSDVRSQEGR